MLEEIKKLCDVRNNMDKDYTKQEQLNTIDEFIEYIDSVGMYDKVKSLLYIIDGAKFDLKGDSPDKLKIKKYSSLLLFMRAATGGTYAADIDKLYENAVAEFGNEEVTK